MSIEGLSKIYPSDREPIVPRAIDAYLSDIEPTDVFNTPEQVIEHPGVIADRLSQIAEAVRHIEVDYHAIAYHGSVLRAVYEKSPQTIEALPEDQRQQVMEIITRMKSNG
jgi:hypothetical protein